MNNTESAVLSAILNDNSRVYSVEDLAPEDFDHPQAQIIFRAMKRLAETQKPIDLVTVGDLAGESLDASTMMELMDAFFPSGSFEHHKAILLNQATKRRLKRLITGLYQAIDTDDTEELLSKAEQSILSLRRTGAAEVISIDTALDQVYSELQHRITNPGIKGTVTGFRSLDEYLFGWQKRRLYILGARPGIGKTALLTQTALHAAEQGKRVLIISLEMGAAELVERIISRAAKIPGHFLQLGKVIDSNTLKRRPFDDRETKAITDTISKFSGLPLAIVDKPGLTVGQIKHYAMQARRQLGGLDLLLVDYLGQIRGKAESQRHLIEANTRFLKDLSKELDLPVVCAAQLSRSPENRADKRPVLADLRESGEIEAAADVVLMLYRESQDATATECELLIRKNRSGRMGTIELSWNGALTEFTEARGRKES